MYKIFNAEEQLETDDTGQVLKFPTKKEAWQYIRELENDGEHIETAEYVSRLENYSLIKVQY